MLSQTPTLPARTGIGPTYTPLHATCGKGRFRVPSLGQEREVAVFAWAPHHLLVLPLRAVPQLLLAASQYAPLWALVWYSGRVVKVQEASRINVGGELRQWACIMPGYEVATIPCGPGLLVCRAEHYHARLAQASNAWFEFLLGGAR